MNNTLGLFLARHSPGGTPHGQDGAYQSQGERSVTAAATGRLRVSTRKTRALFIREW